MLLIALASLFILGSLAIISYIGLTQIKKSNEGFSRIIKEQNKQTALATKMRDAARERMMELWRISLTKDPFARNESYDDFLNHATTYLKAREAFLETELTEQEMVLYNELNQATGKSSTYHRKIADQFMRDEVVSIDEMLTQTLPSQRDSLNALNKIIDFQAIENEQTFKKATVEVERTVNLMIALTASTMLIGVILALIVYRNNAKMRLQLLQSNKKLLRSNQNLESRVMQRTRELQQANSKLQFQAHYDPLTGLANRALLTEQMAVILGQARRESKSVALLFLDLDGFKPVNDKYGHDVGDQMLKILAQRITGSIRSTDLAARIGGDEFVIVLSSIQEILHAETFAEILNAKLQEPMQIAGNVLSVGASIGIGIYPDHASLSDDLIKAADIAMYHAKRDGKACFKVYDKEMPGQGSERKDTLQA